jgi:Tfp pilus assembly PilM family ATPase
MLSLAMSPTSRNSLFQPWRNSRHGWIGVDIGSVATKLVQLERVGDNLQLKAHWIIDRYSCDLLTKESLQGQGRLPFQSQLREARSMFQDRSAAATLPVTMTELRSLELPAGSDDELRNMIHGELLADSAPGFEFSFDYLPTQAADSAEGEMGTFSVFASPASIATSAANSLSCAGFDCEILDSVPCALARATALCEPDLSETPLAALDFGFSSAVLIVAKGGRLLFTRQLRGCSLQMLLKPLQDGLKLSAVEAQQLLCRYTTGLPLDASPLAALAKAAHGMIAEPLNQVASEVKRTLDFLDLQFCSIVPKKLILLGGGAIIPALPNILAEETDLPTRLWALPTADSPSPTEEALFGVAAALSSLAWEATSCT